MQLRDLRATVVGAGIGGATTAMLLARAGASVTLLERVAEPRAIGAGILLQPNGLAVLYGLGLRHAIADRAFMTREGAIYDTDGHALLRSTTFDFGEGLDHFLAIRRSALFEMLIDAVQREPGVSARFGVEVRDLPAGDLVVGADGVHSAVRAAAGVEHRLRSTGVRYVRGLVDGEAVDGFGEYWTPLGLFGMGPVGGATYFFGGTDSPAVAAALAARDLRSFRAAWTEALPVAGAVLSRVEAFDDLLVNEVETVRCRSFVHGHVALLGDAAHAMYPNAGQGANSALVDGAVLVESLARGPDLAAGLRAYDARRRSRVQRVQRDASGLARLAALRSRPLRRWRDAFLRRTAGRGISRGRLDRTMQEDPGALFRSVAAVSGG